MIGPDHKFVEPVKVVKSVDDVKKWEASKAYEVREGNHSFSCYYSTNLVNISRPSSNTSALSRP